MKNILKNKIQKERYYVVPFLVPVPLPVSLVFPLVDGLSLGSGISDNFLLPVPLPEETIWPPAAFFFLLEFS